jgi:hypothetical protein
MDSCRHYPPPAAANWVNRIGFPARTTHAPNRYKNRITPEHRSNSPWATYFEPVSWLQTAFMILHPNCKSALIYQTKSSPNARFCMCCNLWRTNTMSRVLFVRAFRSSGILRPVTGWLCPTFRDSVMIPSSRVEYPIKNWRSHSSHAL